MSEKKDGLVKRLGFGGTVLTVLICAAVFVLNLLLCASLALWFSTYGLEDTQRILDTLKVSDVDLSSTFTTHGEAVAFLSTWQAVVIIIALLVVILVLWGVFYKMFDYYAARAIRIYAKITIVTAAVLLVLSLFSSPIITYYFEDYVKDNSVRIRSFCAVVTIVSLILFIVGIISAIVSLVLSSAEGAPRKKLIDDELLEGSIKTRDIIEQRRSHGKSKKAESESKSKAPKHRAITAAEITPHDKDVLPESADKYCVACGAKLKAGAVFCGKCGEKI